MQNEIGLHFTYYYQPKTHLSIREIELYKD